MMCISPLLSQDSLKLMTYNLLNFPDINPSRISHLKTVLQYVQPDILIVNELNTEAGANDILVQCLNQNGISYYSRALYDDGFGTDNMLFFDSRKIGLEEQTSIQTNLRPISYYKVFLKDWDLANTQDTTFINLFALHLKASTGYEQMRYEEAKDLRDYIDNNLSGEHILVGGDFNVYKSTEACLKVLIDSGMHQLYDPIQVSGKFQDNASYSTIHTQSTRTTEIDDGAAGGLDDRFDLFLCSEDIYNGTGDLTSIPQEYKAIGNDGQHLNLNITDPPTISIYPSNLINALYNFSDHLPVVYTLLTNKDLPDGIIENQVDLKWFWDKESMKLKLSDIGQYKIEDISCYNALGQRLEIDISKNKGSLELAFSVEHKGLHIISIKSSKKTFTLKLIL